MPTSGTVILHSAALRIMDAAHLHTEIERKTGLSPSESHVSGEPIHPRSKRKWSGDLWCLESPLDEEEKLTSHLVWLLGKLSPHSGYLRSLMEAGIRMDIFCGYRSNSDTAGFSVEPSALRLFHELPVPMEVSVIIHSMDELD